MSRRRLWISGTQVGIISKIETIKCGWLCSYGGKKIDEQIDSCFPWGR